MIFFLISIVIALIICFAFMAYRISELTFRIKMIKKEFGSAVNTNFNFLNDHRLELTQAFELLLKHMQLKYIPAKSLKTEPHFQKEE